MQRKKKLKRNKRLQCILMCANNDENAILPVLLLSCRSSDFNTMAKTQNMYEDFEGPVVWSRAGEPEAIR